MLKCKKPIYCLQVWKKLMTLAVCTSRRKQKSTPTLENLVFFFFFSLLRKKKDNKLDYRLEKGLDVTAEAILLNTNMDAKIETKMV